MDEGYKDFLREAAYFGLNSEERFMADNFYERIKDKSPEVIERYERRFLTPKNFFGKLMFYFNQKARVKSHAVSKFKTENFIRNQERRTSEAKEI